MISTLHLWHVFASYAKSTPSSLLIHSRLKATLHYIVHTIVLGTWSTAVTKIQIVSKSETTGVETRLSG